MGDESTKRASKYSLFEKSVFMESEEDILLKQLQAQSHARGPHAKPIGSILKSWMIKRGISDEQSALMTQEEWRKAVGPALAAETRPGNLQRGQLFVYATSNLVLQELHFSKVTILKTLQTALPDFKIRDLRFRVET